MTERREFRPLQAEEIARAFNDAKVDYLFIGKSGAILPGYPGTSQDIDIFPARGVHEGIFPIANLRDIIASKRASGRQKDRIELPLLESFRSEFEKRHSKPLSTAAEITKAGATPTE